MSTTGEQPDYDQECPGCAASPDIPVLELRDPEATWDGIYRDE